MVRCGNWAKQLLILLREGKLPKKCGALRAPKHFFGAFVFRQYYPRLFAVGADIKREYENQDEVIAHPTASQWGAIY